MAVFQGCTHPLSSWRPGAVTWQLAEAHEYQSGRVIHRKRSPDWLINNGFTPNRAWGGRATVAGRCGHDVTGIGKPESQAVGSEVGGSPSSLRMWGWGWGLSQAAGLEPQLRASVGRDVKDSACAMGGGLWPFRMLGSHTSSIQLTSVMGRPPSGHLYSN